MISSKFQPKAIEQKWYDYWIEKNYFASIPDDRQPYTIVIPPPNVTGVLHMGHMLNISLQDILIRRARMQGFNACWVPGTDHASIATEAKVVAHLKQQGISKSDLSREEFLKHAWDWTKKYGGTILKQLQKLGCSCDWDRTKFTLDTDMYESVIQSFVELYEKGLIYRGHRMVNWDPQAQTTLSDEEVLYEEKSDFLYHIAYEVEGEKESVVIATTRPETIFGDTAICIHPKDNRFQHLRNKKVKIPIVNRWIPIIEDEYVDMEFGTGCLKITPAHDINDNMLGEKHSLEIINIFNVNGTLNSNGLHYEGQDRFVVRKAIVKELGNSGVLLKKETYVHKVGISERTKAVIEPRLSDQWFLKMKELVKPAIKSVLDSEEIKLVPSRFRNTYRHWVENIRDWNISRQLWWGQQIPVYYYSDNFENFVVATSPEKALDLARDKSGDSNIQLNDLRQDSDILDTWFSSWLWPISVFDGIRNPNNKDIEYYYPTQDLVTGPDILFFWVTRMIISGYEFRNEKPFSKVYLTGLVRDSKRRKMSKQLGNSPDALQLIEDFGADAVRVGLMLSSVAGNDLLFDESLCHQGKNFTNKIWNAYRLIQGWEVKENLDQPDVNKSLLYWYSQKFQQTLELINDHFDKYRISDAMMACYKLIWDDFCSWLLEAIKPNYGDSIDKKSFNEVCLLFEENLKILHPFMPFITEELWHDIKNRQPNESLIVSRWPIAKEYCKKTIEEFQGATEVISTLRNFRKEKGLGFKEHLTLTSGSSVSIPFASSIEKIGHLTLNYPSSEAALEQSESFRANGLEFFVQLEGKIDIEKERIKLEQEIEYAKGFLISVQKKLTNDRFVSNAPEEVLAKERKKEKDTLEKIELLRKSIKKF